MTNGYTQQFDWAARRLRQEFGDDRVEVRATGEGQRITARVSPGGNAEEDKESYEVLFRDPVLGDLNRISDPEAFLEAEIGFIRKWFAGESRRRRTYL